MSLHFFDHASRHSRRSSLWPEHEERFKRLFETGDELVFSQATSVSAAATSVDGLVSLLVMAAVPEDRPRADEGDAVEP